VLVVNGLLFLFSRGVARSWGAHELIPVLFLLGGLWSVRRDGDDTGRFGIRLEGLFPGAEGDPRSLVRTVWEGLPSALRETLLAAGLCLVVFPVYAWAWPLFNRPVGPRHFTLDAARWQELATQLLAVAFTEELYFRGYVLTRCLDAVGVPVGPDGRVALGDLRRCVGPVVVTAALFAVTHVLVEPTVPRAVVFFPALLFGALRLWRGGIGAAVLLHAASNVFETWLEGR
jgi:membrane protease YdiL (CAAX protease family)